MPLVMQVPVEVMNQQQLHFTPSMHGDRTYDYVLVPSILFTSLAGAPAIVSQQFVQGGVTHKLGAMASVQEEKTDFVEFVIKNPARSTTPPFILRARAGSTVSDLKKRLQAEYNGKPDPQTQTVLLLL